MAEAVQDDVERSETAVEEDYHNVYSSPENWDRNSNNLNGNNNESEEEGFEYEGELPLEVITTVSKDSHSPVLKVKSNGVLTHRNIFTDTERAVLKDIVVDYQEIVDTRSRSRDTFIEKQQAWQKIVVEYNDRPGMQPRTVKELRKCWDNMKYRARQAEKEIQQKSLLQEQAYQQMLTFGDVSITQEGLNFVNGVENLDDKGTDTHSINGVLKQNSCSSKLKCEDGGLLICGQLDNTEPAFKKARQDAPKLSSLLMAGAWTSRSSSPNEKSDTINNLSNDTVSDIRDEFVSHHNITSTCATKVKNINLNYVSSSSNCCPIQILPKSKSSDISVANVATSKGVTTFHLGSGMTITSQSSNPPILEHITNQATVRPMPALKKMGIKQECNSKKSKSKCKYTNPSLCSSLEQEDLLTANDLCYFSEHRELYTRLLHSRLEHEEQEHLAKMKTYEKQLQLYSQQSHYWAFKMKLLKAGRDNDSHSLVNGEVNM